MEGDQFAAAAHQQRVFIEQGAAAQETVRHHGGGKDASVRRVEVQHGAVGGIQVNARAIRQQQQTVAGGSHTGKGQAHGTFIIRGDARNGGLGAGRAHDQGIIHIFFFLTGQAAQNSVGFLQQRPHAQFGQANLPAQQGGGLLAEDIAHRDQQVAVG